MRKWILHQPVVNVAINCPTFLLKHLQHKQFSIHNAQIATYIIYRGEGPKALSFN